MVFVTMSYRTHYLIPARVVHTGISVLLLSLVFGLLNTVLLTRSRLGMAENAFVRSVKIIYRRTFDRDDNRWGAYQYTRYSSTRRSKIRRDQQQPCRLGWLISSGTRVHSYGRGRREILRDIAVSPDPLLE